MLAIGDLFAKIKGLQAREMLFRTMVCQAIKSRSGIDIEPQAVQHSKGRVTIKGISHSAKSQLFMKKMQIIEEINKLQDVHVVKELN